MKNRKAPGIIFFSLLALPLALFAQEVEDKAAKEKDPYEWTYELFSFPSNELGLGFTSPERGALKPPRYPGDDASDEVMLDYLKKSNSIVTHYLELEGLSLPKGALVVFDYDSLTVATRLPRIAQSSMAFTSDSLQSGVSKYLSIRHRLFEAPGDKIREAIAKADGKGDHTEALDYLLQAVEENSATILEGGVSTIRPGERVKLERVEEKIVPVEHFVGSDDSVEYDLDESKSGFVLEIEPLLGADDDTVDLAIGLNHHYAKPISKEFPVSVRNQKKISVKATDSFQSRLASSYIVRAGSNKLIGVWKPEKHPDPQKADTLHAAFVTTNVVKVLPLLNNKLLTMLKKYGETIAPVPEGKVEYKKVAEEIPEGMIVRQFVVPPSFLQSQGASRRQYEMDPFATPDNEPRFMVRATAKDMLQQLGIIFPPGSSANYIRSTSTLVVRNKPDQIELVESYLMSIRGSVSRSVAITLHLVEAPSEALRQAANDVLTISNHIKVWENLTQVEGFNYINTSWLEGRPGERVTSESGRDFHYLEPDISTDGEKSIVEEDGKKKVETQASDLYAAMDFRKVGLKLDCEPLLGADDVTIDLGVAIDYDYAEPVISGAPEFKEDEIVLDGTMVTFKKVRLNSYQTMRTGSMRMLGMWNPKGAGGDRMQAAFIKAVLVNTAETSKGMDSDF